MTRCGCGLELPEQGGGGGGGGGGGTGHGGGGGRSMELLEGGWYGRSYLPNPGPILDTLVQRWPNSG